jgi:uncharacterized protein (TIGR00730 family)
MGKLKSICVFCGANLGHNPQFERDAFTLGQLCAESDITVIYGAAKVGIMGVIARGCLSKQGKIIGIVPQFLMSKEIIHEELTEIVVVEDMHTRKALMHDKSEGFIILPGGYGTLDEMFEALTWLQLGRHQKPIGILNSAGYYDHLIAFLQHMVTEGLLRKENYDLLLVDDSVEGLLAQMEAFEHQHVGKWM